jgi:hypothetical protein
MIVATLVMIGIALLVPWRLAQVNLRDDHAATDFLSAAASTLEPGSLVISSADAETFALWYGEWGGVKQWADEAQLGDATQGIGRTAEGSGPLAQADPDLILVNYALYQFVWYRKLMHDLYPEVPKLGASFAEVIEANRSLRPIYFTELLPELPSTELIPVGIFWRLQTP